MRSRQVIGLLALASSATALVAPPSSMSSSRHLRVGAATASPPLERVNVDVSGDGCVRKVESSVVDGVGSEEGGGRVLSSDGDVVVLDFLAVTASGQLLDKGEGSQYTVGDERYVPAWDACVRSLREGERAVFECDASYAYGSGGVPPAVRGGERLVLTLRALEYRGNVRTSSSFASDKPLTPRTASAIKAEYEKRRDAKVAAAAGDDLAKRARDAATEGDVLKKAANLLDDLKANVKGFYFFGFFESQTGETPPWYLRPMLTFPAIFAGVGLAFYVLVAADAILLRGESSPIPGEGGFSL